MSNVRYAIEYDEYVWWVIDTTIPDGEVCNVDGAFNRVDAQIKCDALNFKQKEKSDV